MEYEKEYIDEKKIYSTKDFYCAAALIAVGHEFITVDKTNPKKVIFSFHASQELLHHVNLFWMRKLELNATAVFEAQRSLKAIIHN